MKARTGRKVRATLNAILNILMNDTNWMFLPSKRETIRRLKSYQPLFFEQEYWKEYLASSVKDGVDKLLRKGKVEIRETNSGIEVKITNRGKLEVLKYRLSELVLQKPAQWDGKWRLVIFDVDETARNKRDELRRWLVRLGLKLMQKSVWIYPYPLEEQIKFLREILETPHAVKLVLAEKIDNDHDLREWFDL
ncbi:MAG: hypothetical protein AAB768_00930 [Patescibacteria group bacterium]